MLSTDLHTGDTVGTHEVLTVDGAQITKGEQLTKRASERGCKWPRQVRGPWWAGLAGGGESTGPGRGLIWKRA